MAIALLSHASDGVTEMTLVVVRCHCLSHAADGVAETTLVMA
jgi:hypothetical protein